MVYTPDIQNIDTSTTSSHNIFGQNVKLGHDLWHVFVPLLVFHMFLLGEYKSDGGDRILMGLPYPVNFSHTIQELGCYNVRLLH